MSRTGIPKMFISDNGKTFKENELAEFATRNNISWKFNIERAPWWGGLFERLIKSVKRCRRKNVRRARLTYEELETVLGADYMVPSWPG
jgi:transposase InsO family protein